MLIYNVNPESEETKSPNQYSHLTTIPVDVKSHGKGSPLSLDNEYMFSRYGFHLSKYECDQFHTHHEIWTGFKKSDAPFCLIINEYASVKFPQEADLTKINEKLSESLDWDIFFPFERSVVEDSSEFEPGYLLGCYWGVDAYFISRGGADKLLEIKVIRQPLDEEILTKSISGELEVYSEETDHFNLQENVLHKKERRLAIKDAIFQSPAWSSETKVMIQKIMHIISNIANENNIELILCDGSLLGQIRHGCIMPWDDDVDLGLNMNDFAKFSAVLKSQTTLTSSICYWGSAKVPYYKIWDEGGQPIERYPYTFPFVDIWFFTDEHEQIVFDAGTVYPKAIYYPLSETLFEGSLFKLPAKPQECLDISYKDWRNKVQVFSWSHQLEQNSIVPLTMDINVDDDGRIIDEKY